MLTLVSTLQKCHQLRGAEVEVLLHDRVRELPVVPALTTRKLFLMKDKMMDMKQRAMVDVCEKL